MRPLRPQNVLRSCIVNDYSGQKHSRKLSLGLQGLALAQRECYMDIILEWIEQTSYYRSTERQINFDNAQTDFRHFHLK